MIRSELKKKAQRHLHRNYGNWSWIVLIPCMIGVGIYFLLLLFNPTSMQVQENNQYRSWQDDYSNNYDSNLNQDYNNGYDDGYLDGYEDGIADYYDEDDYYEEDKDVFDTFKSDNLHSLTYPAQNVSHRMMNRSITHGYPARSKAIIGRFFFFDLYILFILGIILYKGLIQWAAMDNVSGQTFSLKTVFDDYIKKNGRRTISANLLVALYTFLWSLLLIIPGVVKQLSYAMTNYLLKKDPTLSSKEAMDLSQELMKGYKLEYLIFAYSFILWYIASTFSFGLVSLYVIPYYSVSEVLFFDQIIEEKHHLFTEEKEAGFTDF